MEQRVKNAIEVFIKAIDNGTLAKGSCIACAVGNLVAKGMGATIEVKNNDIECDLDNSIWGFAFHTLEGKQIKRYNLFNRLGVIINIESTEFYAEELMQIEYAFETSTKIYFEDYNKHTYSEILNDQIKGLEAVIEVMLSFNNDTETNVKEVFTNRVLELKKVEL